MTSAWDVIETVGASVSKNFGTEGSNHCSMYRLQSFKKLWAVKFDCFKTIKYSHPLSLNADLSCLVKRILLGQALERFAAVYITPKICLPPFFFSFWDWSWTLDSLASNYQILVLQVCSTMPCVWHTGYWTQGFMFAGQVLCQLSYVLSPVESPWHFCYYVELITMKQIL